MRERALIAVVEDDPAIARAVRARLTAEGFAVTIAGDGPAAIDLCRRLDPDLVILDLMLPGLDGLEVCRRIQRDNPMPVLMLTARDDETDVIVGLEVGADDYMTKPFSPRELVARVRALLRRRSREPATRRGPLELGDVRLDAASRTAERSGEHVHLTVTEFDLARFLLLHPGVVYTREQLLHAVWGYTVGAGPRTVDSHVQALRRKLGAGFVRTAHGVGYALGAPS